MHCGVYLSRPPSPRAPALTGAVCPLLSHYDGFECPEQLASDARISPSVREWLLAEGAEDLLRRVHVCLERLSPPESPH